MKNLKTQTPVILKSLNTDLEVPGILVTTISVGYPVFIYTDKNKWFITQKVTKIQDGIIYTDFGNFKIIVNEVLN